MADRVRRFASSHPAWFAAVCTIVAMVVWAVELDGDPIGGLDLVATHAVTSALAWALMGVLAIRPVAGFRRAGLLRGVLLGAPLYGIAIASALFSNPGADLSALRTAGASAILLFTLDMLMVGLAEEILFRGLILRNFLAVWGKTRAGIGKAIRTSALIFGAVHLLNMAVAPPLTVLVQTVNAACAGVLFAAITLRSGNLWAVILVHAVADWLALAPQQLLPQATSIISGAMAPWQGVLVLLVGAGVPLAASWLLLRKDSVNA